jgi:uroporphyrin-III C-methyltransferase / precorrin-2 dehydrogenase / sirohydrochlorin ferrochelatase
VEQLPIFLQSKGKVIAVCGGGTIAARNAEMALRAGAEVRVFASSLSGGFRTIETRLTHLRRAPDLAGLSDCCLVFSATGDARADREVFELARLARVPVNVADAPELSDFTMPSIVDRDPLVIAISTGGASPVFARMLRARLESVIPSAYGRLVALLGAYRDRLGAVLKDGAARRRFWEQVLEGPVLSRFLAGHEEEAKAELDRAIDNAASGTSEKPAGEVYLVGAGPGDPDLLTFRALRLMQRADVILYDRLLPHGILDLVQRDAEHIYVGKLPEDHILPQEEITALLVKLAKEGKRVLRLKGGDPFIFGRGGEEIEALAAEGIPFQVVPGITAATGCAAYAGIPLTHRDHAQACVFVTGHARAGGGLSLDWSVLIQPRQTVAIFMGLGQLRELMKQYIAHGGDPALPAAIIDNGTRPNQRVVTGTVETLADLAEEARLKGPAITILGTVVTLRGKLIPDDCSAHKEKPAGLTSPV